jgi:hypothetical protein
MKLLFSFALLLAACVANSLAATYYVSTNGSDTNSGVDRSPWRTVQKAANTMVAGDTVIVANGTYPEVVQTKENGTAGSPITFTGSGLSTLWGFGIYHSWNSVDNFRFTTSPAAIYAAIAFTGSNLRITRNTISDMARASLKTLNSGGSAPPVADWPSNIYIAGNTFSNITTVSAVFQCSLNASNIESNRIDSCACDAFDLWGSNNTIRNNVVTNMLRDTFGLARGTENHNDFIQTWRAGTNFHSTNNLIEGNMAINCYGQMANLEDNNFTNDFGHWTFRNNIFINCLASMNMGIAFSTFENNTFYRSPNGSNEVHSIPIVFLNQDGFHGSGSTLTNNLFIACGFSNAVGGLKLGYYAAAAGASPRADYNYVAGLAPGYAPISPFSEPHGINGGNPRFVNPDNGDVRLRSVSPAIGRAANLSGVFTTDKAGNLRTGDWDVGAYEYQSGNSPAAPSGLKIPATPSP